MTFRMIVAARPLSRQTRGGVQPYIASLRKLAAEQYQDGPLLVGSLYARIVWFYSEGTELDTDNIIKPILDALIGIAYADDHSIVRCSAERVDIREPYALMPEGVPHNIHATVNQLLESSPAHILYVEVGPLLERRIFLGPVDGEA